MLIDQSRFQEALEAAGAADTLKKSIGTLGEKTLHAVLKYYIEPDARKHEQKVGRCVADILDGQSIVEIQTRSFEHLRAKLSAFLPTYDVTVVYPLPRVKYVCWIDPENGTISQKRRSPKSWSIHEAFWELNKLSAFFDQPHLHFRFLFLELTEYRTLDGWSHDKKRGSTRFDRIPHAVLEDVFFDSAASLGGVIPADLPALFTAGDYASCAHIDVSRARQAIRFFLNAGCLEFAGKKGKSKLYART